MPNVISILGYTILPIHVQVLQLFVTALFGAGFLGFVYQRYNEWRGRAYDRFSISRTYVKTEIGVGSERFVTIRNIGSNERLEDKVRGRWIRKLMVSAAKRCTSDQQFIALENPKHQTAMLEAVRDAISWIGVEGEIADAAGFPTKETSMVFAVTATDVTADGVQTFRVHLIEETMLRRFLDTTSMATWHFPGAGNHARRLGIVQEIARAHGADGYRIINGRSTLILGQFMLKVRV